MSDESGRIMLGALMDAADRGVQVKVLVDGFDEERQQGYGRTYADSPEIDGRVWIGSEEPLREGDFISVKIDGCEEGDLTGFVTEESR